VPDYVEEKDGTNPNDASDFKDSDKDGIPDYLDKVDNSNNGITNSGSNNGSGSKNGTGSNNKSTTKTNTNVKSGKATKTGDMANAGVYGALGGSSLLLYAVLLVLKRRKHEK
jgi:LPXTG-motif cell wall-anchored protein